MTFSVSYRTYFLYRLLNRLWKVAVNIMGTRYLLTNSLVFNSMIKVLYKRRFILTASTISTLVRFLLTFIRNLTRTIFFDWRLLGSTITILLRLKVSIYMLKSCSLYRLLDRTYFSTRITDVTSN